MANRSINGKDSEKVHTFSNNEIGKLASQTRKRSLKTVEGELKKLVVPDNYHWCEVLIGGGAEHENRWFAKQNSASRAWLIKGIWTWRRGGFSEQPEYAVACGLMLVDVENQSHNRVNATHSGKIAGKMQRFA